MSSTTCSIYFHMHCLLYQQTCNQIVIFILILTCQIPVLYMGHWATIAFPVEDCVTVVPRDGIVVTLTKCPQYLYYCFPLHHLCQSATLSTVLWDGGWELSKSWEVLTPAIPNSNTSLKQDQVTKTQKEAMGSGDWDLHFLAILAGPKFQTGL